MTHDVLIVEDETTLLRGLLRGLSSVHSCQFSGCTSVEEALSSIAKKIPDLLITDLNFTGLTGLDLLDHLRRHHIRIPVIVMTAYHDKYKDELPDSNNLTVIEKPVRLADMRKLIEKKLDNAAEASSSGPFKVVDYLQMACLGRHSLMLEITIADEEPGYIEIYEGEIWNAQLGAYSPEDAMRMLTYQPTEHLRYSSLTNAPEERRLYRRWEDLLLESARVHDEQHKTRTAEDTSAQDSFSSFSVSDMFGVFEAPEVKETVNDPKNIYLSIDSDTHSVANITPAPLTKRSFVQSVVREDQDSDHNLQQEPIPEDSSTDKFVFLGQPMLSLEALHPETPVSQTSASKAHEALHPPMETNVMANNNIQECLSTLTELDGFVGACLADSASGMSLGSIGGGELNLAVAAASNSEVIKSKRKAIKNLRLKENIEDILISLSTQYHLIRPSRIKEELFFYLVLDRQRSNLALARIALNDVENNLKI